MPAPEIPPLGKFVVQEYDGKDAAYPIIVQVRDPKVGGYVLPSIFSACPDSRYSATHVYVGPVPTSVDTRVLWTYMRLPGPWIPFTRYDNNLGPVQGRRRAVAFTTQTASLTVSSKKTYEAKDGSEYVSWETEETYSDGTGAAGNPAFPVLITDFYDPQRGAVQQAAQVVTATGSEVGSLAIAGGVVTQIRYEPFPENKFLLQKITETWNLTSAPALGGKVLTNKKQIGTLVKKLVAAGTAASSGALVESSSVQPVNAIWSEENTVTIPSLLSLTTTSKQDSDWGTQTTIAADSAAGTVSPDAITGSLIASEVKQLDAAVDRKTNTSITDPISTVKTEKTAGEFGTTTTTITNHTTIPTAPAISATVERTTVDQVGISRWKKTVDEIGDPATYNSSSASNAPYGSIATTTTFYLQTTAPAKDALGGAVVESEVIQVARNKFKKVTKTVTVRASYEYNSAEYWEFEDTLISVSLIATSGYGEGASAGGGASANVAYSWDGDANVQINKGHRGACQARIVVTHYLPDTAISTSAITPVAFRASHGTLVIFGGSFERRVFTGDSTGYNTEIRTNAKLVTIPPVLTAGLALGTANVAYAYGSPFISYLRGTLPASSPTTNPTGEFFAKVTVSEGEYGIRKVEQIYITPPT